jgi:hypothetical protein
MTYNQIQFSFQDCCGLNAPPQKNTKTETKKKFFFIKCEICTQLVKKGKSKFVPIHTMKVNEALVVQAHLILALDEGEWLTSRPGHFTARKECQ